MQPKSADRSGREEKMVLVALLERAGMFFGPWLSPASLEAGYNGAVSRESKTFSE